MKYTNQIYIGTILLERNRHNVGRASQRAAPTRRMGRKRRAPT